MRIFISEGYYDPTDQNNPVKYKFNSRITVPVNYGWFSEKNLRIKQNQVKKLDGTIANFPSIQYEDTNFFGYSSYYLSILYLDLSDNYDYYDMYVDYQPVIDSSRRNLDSASDEEEIMSPEYFAFYIMAQMGGLYTFFILIFGIFVNHYNKQAFNHTTINEVYRFNIMKNVEDEQYDVSANHFDRNHGRRVMPANSREVPLGNQSIYRENDPLMNQQAYPPDENIYENNQNRMSIGQPVNLHNYQNYDKNQMYDGGDEMEDLERRRNGVDQEHSAYYDFNDLLYSVFCCNRGNDNNSRRSRVGRNGQFKNELEIFDEERDLVNIITSINTMKSQIGAVEEKVENIQVIQQAAPNPEPVKKHNKKKTKSFSNPNPEKNVHPINIARKKTKVENIEMENVSKQTKTNSGHHMPEEEKTPSYSGEYIKNTATAHIKNQMKPKNGNDSVSQILDDIENKGKNIKGNVRSIHQIVENEIQDIGHQKKHNKERRHKKDKSKAVNSLIEQPGYETNQTSVVQQQIHPQTREPAITEVQNLQKQSTLPRQSVQTYNQPPSSQAYDQPPVSQAYDQPPVSQAYDQPPASQAYDQPPPSQAYNQAPPSQTPQTYDYSTPSQQPAQMFNPAPGRQQPQARPTSPRHAPPISHSQTAPQNQNIQDQNYNQKEDSFDFNQVQDRFDPNIDYYRAQSKKNSELWQFQ